MKKYRVWFGVFCFLTGLNLSMLWFNSDIAIKALNLGTALICAWNAYDCHKRIKNNPWDRLKKNGGVAPGTE